MVISTVESRDMTGLMTNDERAYVNSLTEKEYRAYIIARDHMGILFTLVRCNGYLKWKKDQCK